VAKELKEFIPDHMISISAAMLQDHFRRLFLWSSSCGQDPFPLCLPAKLGRPGNDASSSSHKFLVNKIEGLVLFCSYQFRTETSRRPTGGHW